MTQYKDTTKLANTPTGTGRGIIERITTVMLFAFLLIFGLCLISCQPSQAGENLIKLVVKTVTFADRNNLQNITDLGDNASTTKYIAVTPSRHSLAIFMPKICEPTKPTFTTGIKQRHFYNAYPSYGSIASYGGLIRPNKIAFMVNKSSRLYTVVETRHPLMLGGKNTTKYIGEPTNG